MFKVSSFLSFGHPMLSIFLGHWFVSRAHVGILLFELVLCESFASEVENPTFGQPGSQGQRRVLRTMFLPNSWTIKHCMFTAFRSRFARNDHFLDFLTGCTFKFFKFFKNLVFGWSRVTPKLFLDLPDTPGHPPRARGHPLRRFRMILKIFMFSRFFDFFDTKKIV